jgi:hypothetical protein
LKKFFYICLSVIFLSAIFYGATDAKSMGPYEPEVDRLFPAKEDVQVTIENPDGSQSTLPMGKTPIELKDIAINSPLYASYWGSSDTIGFGSAPMLTCVYNWTKASVNVDFLDTESIEADGSIDGAEVNQSTMQDLAAKAESYSQTQIPTGITITAPLYINNFMTSGKSREILFGISDLEYCPLPGSAIFSDYNKAVSGEFLLTGAICVINSILFDTMFKIYCTIVIWFYNIMYAMIIIYIMFYGMALMLGIGQDPIKEAPKKILKILIIFMLVTNAQVGFRYVHTFFITVLNSFSSMLSDMQTVTDSFGNDAYQSKLSEFYGAFKSLGVEGPDGTSPDNTLEDLFIKKGKLLNINGDVWRPLEMGEALNALNNAGSGGFNTLYAPGYDESNEVSADNYVPFRVPNQQWQYTPEKLPNGVITYTIEPVYKPLVVPSRYSADSGLKACILDFRYAPNNADDQPWNWQIQAYLRCPKDNKASFPYFLPYGVYCIYDTNVIDTKPDLFEVGVSSSPVLECRQGTEGANTQLIRLKNQIGNLTEECDEVSDFFASLMSKTAISSIAPNSSIFKPCRSGFQGIFAKADNLISGMIGGDRSKGIGGLLAAFASWSIGGGLLLSLFMMTGFFAVTFVAIQIVWTFVTAVMALSFLLMVSPVFISFLLFKTTEKLFRGWLNSVISYTLQPILMLAFVFFISAITSVDKITYLMNEELVSKTMVVGGAQESDKKMLMRTTGFVEPLYEKPSDFDTFYYDNSLKSDSKSTLINGQQRDRYLERKGKNLLETFFNKHPKFGNGNTFADPNAQIANAEYANKIYSEIMNLWDNGVYPIELPKELDPKYYELGANFAKPLTVSKYKGIKALEDYYNVSNYLNTGSPWFTVSGDIITAWAKNYGTRIIDEILEFYKNGGCFRPCNTDPLQSFTSGNDSCYVRNIDNNPDYTTYVGLCNDVEPGLVPPSDEVNPNQLGTSIDDGDSFIGEPASINGQYWPWVAQGQWQTWFKAKEYPTCKRFCPKFNPVYEPNNFQKPWLANPDINIVPKTTNEDGTECPSDSIYPDGTPCPDNDNDGKPDECYTPKCYGWTCEKYCMYIKNAKSILYKDVLSAILAFILINMVAAAFISKMPELASALSNWAPGQHAVKIGGGSKIMGDKGGGDAWTKAEMSDVYSVGGIFNMDPNRPGTLLGLANKAAALTGIYDVVDMKTGAITKSKLGPLDIMRGGLLGGGVSNAQKSQENADFVNSFKGIFKLSKSESFSTDKRVNEDDLSALSRFIKPKDPESWQKIFEKFRPDNPTGLKHSEIWDIIQRNLGRYPNPEAVKQAIMSEIQELIQKKIPDESKKTTK